MKPIILIPMGDPAGIGPEIVAKALAREETVQRARCVVVGDRRVMEQAEWHILPQAVSLFCEGRLRVERRIVHIL